MEVKYYFILFIDIILVWRGRLKYNVYTLCTMMAMKPQFNFLELSDPSLDPTGLTIALDDGLPPRRLDDQLSMCGEWIDLVKLGWGTGYVTNQVDQKVELYQEYDIDVFFGGTLFEVAVQYESVSRYCDTLRALGVNHVEVSTGTIELSHERKREYIDSLSESLNVLSEVGRKDADETMEPEEWCRRCRRELDAGASYIILEGRASGSAGVYESDGEIRDEIIEAVTDEVPVERLIFETPKKNQQAWFINSFGPDVGLGNIPMEDVLGLRTLRLGLRGDTLQTIHGGNNDD